MLLRLIPQKTEIGFVKWRGVAFVFSLLLVIASIALFTFDGLNFGIDFKGGTEIEISTETPADIGKIRSTLGTLDLGDVQVKEFGADTEVLIVIEQQEAAEGEEVSDVEHGVVPVVKAALDEAYGEPITYQRINVVGGKVSGELTRSGAIAVVTAVVMMLLYIWFRFEWQFSVGAVLALVHDVILTIGMFSLTQMEFNLSIIAAILTIVGYSMNDTVVVYDRVRENLRKFKRMPLDNLLDLSVNDTLSRTVMTSFTTLLALFSLYIFGPEVIRGFTFAMIWGIFVGTYSSIFVAAPFLLAIGVKRDWSGVDAPGKPPSGSGGAAKPSPSKSA